MMFDFEKILIGLLALALLIVVLDQLFFVHVRRYFTFINKRVLIESYLDKAHVLVDSAYALLPTLLIVVVFRSFIFEPFRIPTGSLEPTLLQGDFVLVNKFIYGLKLPIWGTKILSWQQPQRGDIIVFHWPPNTHYYFIKRIVGLPGDHIAYIDKHLVINGYHVPQTLISSTVVNQASDDLLLYKERLLGVEHNIYLDRLKTTHNYYDLIVPKGMYFVMGDNRDNSADSRYWGFVPEQHIIGKAIVTWFSWDSMAAQIGEKIRWHRIGVGIH